VEAINQMKANLVLQKENQRLRNLKKKENLKKILRHHRIITKMALSKRVLTIVEMIIPLLTAKKKILQDYQISTTLTMMK